MMRREAQGLSVVRGGGGPGTARTEATAACVG
jgi:hypothetical protein